MSRGDVESRIKDKLERKMLQLQQRLMESPDAAELKAEMLLVDAEIAQVKAAMTALELERPQEAKLLEQRDRLAARLEQLTARKEYMGLRMELYTERQERLRETLEELRQNYEQQKPMGDGVSSRWGDTQAALTCSSQAMQEERRKVLEMLQGGAISVDDANHLLSVLGEQEGKLRAQRRPRWVRIRVTAKDTGHTRVNITLPIGLVKAGLRAGGTIAGIEGLDTKNLEALLSRGEVGYWKDMVDERDTERVEISVE